MGSDLLLLLLLTMMMMLAAGIRELGRRGGARRGLASCLSVRCSGIGFWYVVRAWKGTQVHGMIEASNDSPCFSCWPTSTTTPTLHMSQAYHTQPNPPSYPTPHLDTDKHSQARARPLAAFWVF